MPPVRSHRDLIVWQKAMDLVICIYAITELLPKNEVYGLSNQMRRSAISIPSNIAEGRRRGTKNDFRHFLNIAFGSGAELETQLEIVSRLPFGKDIALSQAATLLSEVMRMLNTMIRQLSPTSYKLPATSL